MTDTTTMEALARLIEIMSILRSPNGCQWDREQTPQSLKPYILEETYELLDAIDHGNPAEICDELGDLMLQVIFQAQVFSESGDFTIKDVANAISNKLERRHPHIFATATHEGHQQRWENIKLQERAERGQSNKLADRIPCTLPALKRAEKTAKKSQVTELSIGTATITAELDVLQRLTDTDGSNRAELEAAFGRLLFSVTALAQAMGVDAEDSLRMTTSQIIKKIDNSKEQL
ncbi:MAG TPA: MazG family protein [Malonomonas sp.]